MKDIIMEARELLPAPFAFQESKCELFGDFGVFIQIILGVSSILSLLCKKAIINVL